MIVSRTDDCFASKQIVFDLTTNVFDIENQLFSTQKTAVLDINIKGFRHKHYCFQHQNQRVSTSTLRFSMSRSNDFDIKTIVFHIITNGFDTKVKCYRHQNECFRYQHERVLDIKTTDFDSNINYCRHKTKQCFRYQTQRFATLNLRVSISKTRGFDVKTKVFGIKNKQTIHDLQHQH